MKPQTMNVLAAGWRVEGWGEGMDLALHRQLRGATVTPFQHTHPCGLSPSTSPLGSHLPSTLIQGPGCQEGMSRGNLPKESLVPGQGQGLRGWLSPHRLPAGGEGGCFLQSNCKSCLPRAQGISGETWPVVARSPRWESRPQTGPGSA